MGMSKEHLLALPDSSGVDRDIVDPADIIVEYAFIALMLSCVSTDI